MLSHYHVNYAQDMNNCKLAMITSYTVAFPFGEFRGVAFWMTSSSGWWPLSGSLVIEREGLEYSDVLSYHSDVILM